MEQELSYVGMETCFYCGEPKGILLDRRLKHTLPDKAVYNKEPCDKCKEWLTKGIMLIEVEDGTDKENPYRTGNLWVLKEEAVSRMPFKSNKLKTEVLKKRVMFIEESICKSWGLKNEEEQ